MAPYRFPLFRAIANHSEIDLTVWFMSRSARNRMWKVDQADLGFEYDVLPSLELNYLTRDLFTYIVNYTFPWRYLERPFDVMISAGWLDFACQTGFLVSKLLNRKFVLWSESTAYEPSARRNLAAPLVKTMVRGADTCIAVGSRSRDYLLSLGARRQDVFTAFSTVDVDLFRQLSAAARMERDQLRSMFGIAKRYVLLYCGQLIERKGLRDLIDAFGIIKQQFDDVALAMVGYGPLRQELLTRAASLGVSDVHVLPHVEVGEMPRMYAMADIFVLPSLEETWGLVVNEAMASGLPVIVSERAGASVDLVVDGENGYVVPPANAECLAERCLALLKNDALRQKFAACTAQRIMRFTPETAAVEFVRAVQYAVDR